IGQGGMGEVLEVEHVGLGRRFALKVLRLERWSDELVRRFNREARALARVTTPRVAQVTDFGVDESCGPYYVMELLDGETLEDRLEREGVVSPQEALTICAELCDALSEVHAAGIVHR
ncbi:MAG TPA: serine/threonine protein kinase, partial [Myxococcales bacterium]|nr:serine/threonine protein kinase [Myxococcales bacterium]